MKYILDTNTFWDVLKNWNSVNVSDILSKLKDKEVITFALSEISAMEIHSVLGKCIRGIPKGEHKCERTIKTEQGISVCTNTWITSNYQKRLNERETKDLIRLINDILKQRDKSFNVSIIPLTDEIIEKGGNLLQKYAYRYDFHSLDALIGATAIKTSKTLLTYDKKLKNVLIEEGLSVE